MNPDFAIQVARQAMIITLLLSAPMLLFGLIVGLLISMTLTFIPKIIAILLAFIIFLPWLLRTIMDFTIWIFTLIQGM